MPGNIRLYGTTGYVELAAPATGNNATLTLPTDSIQPGLVKIADQTFSSVSSVSLNNCFSSTYQNYRILLDYTPVASATFYYRFRTNGSDNTTSNYQFQRHQAASTTITAIMSTSQNALGSWGPTGGFPMFQQIDLYSPFASSYTVGWYSFARMNGTTVVDVEQGTNAFSTATSFDGITFYLSTSTMSGTVRVYGYRN